MPENPLVTQWKQRAGAVIADSVSARASVDRALPGVRGCAANLRAALRLYWVAHASAHERDLLIGLGGRAGERAVSFSARGAVAWDQRMDESNLATVNKKIAACHAVIGIGKIAEAGLGAYGWVTSVKETLDKLKLIVDAAKAAQPVVEGALDKNAGSAFDHVNAGGQVISVLLRLFERFKPLGQNIWNQLATIRRARNAEDAWTALAAIAQVLKTVVELCHDFLAAQWDDPRLKAGMNLDQIKGVATGLGVLRDLVEAGRALAAALDAYAEAKACLDRMDQRVTASHGFIGDEARALSSLPDLDTLNEFNFDAALATATDFNRARLLADAAREKARRLTAAMSAASTLRREQGSRFKQALKSIEPMVNTIEQILVRMRVQIEEFKVIQNRNGAQVANANELFGRLSAEHNLLMAARRQVVIAASP